MSEWYCRTAVCQNGTAGLTGTALCRGGIYAGMLDNRKHCCDSAGLDGVTFLKIVLAVTTSKNSNLTFTGCSTAYSVDTGFLDKAANRNVIKKVNWKLRGFGHSFGLIHHHTFWSSEASAVIFYCDCT